MPSNAIDSDLEVVNDSEDSENKVPDDTNEFINEIGEENLRRSSRICE